MIRSVVFAICWILTYGVSYGQEPASAPSNAGHSDFAFSVGYNMGLIYSQPYLFTPGIIFKYSNSSLGFRLYGQKYGSEAYSGDINRKNLKSYAFDHSVIEIRTGIEKYYDLIRNARLTAVMDFVFLDISGYSTITACSPLECFNEFRSAEGVAFGIVPGIGVQFNPSNRVSIQVESGFNVLWFDGELTYRYEGNSSGLDTRQEFIKPGIQPYMSDWLPVQQMSVNYKF